MTEPRGFFAWLRHAFAVELPVPLSDQEEDLLRRLADFLVSRRLTEAALMTLETCRPLNFIGAQALTFLRPFIQAVFRRADEVDRFASLLERRGTIGEFIRILEEQAAASRGKTEKTDGA